jgi:hypothetical protein
MEMWSEAILKIIGDGIGKFIGLEQGFDLEIDR